MVPTAQRRDRSRRRLGELVVELDRNAEVDADLAERVAQVVVLAVRVAAAIDDDNQPAPPAHHLVESRGSRSGRRRTGTRTDAGRWSGRGLPCTSIAVAKRGPGYGPRAHSRRPRVAQPGSEPGVEQRHDEAHDRRRVVPHVRARRRTGDGDRGAERDAPAVLRRRPIVVAAAAVHRADRERLRLALLPRQAPAGRRGSASR